MRQGPHTGREFHPYGTAHFFGLQEFGGLFDDEAKLTEEDLTGKSEESEEKPPAEEKKEPPAAEAKGLEKKVEEEEQKEDEKKDEEPETEKVETKDESSKKPPKGFVPKEALAEARGEIRALKERINALEAAPKTEKQSSKQDDTWKDFKVLSDDEYEELADDDPSEALRYMNKLRRFEKYKAEKDREEVSVKENQARMQSLIDDYANQIVEAIPGVYDEEDTSVADELVKTAEELGFDDGAYLEVMTDPRTLVIPHGQQKSYLLGPGVLGFLKVLSNAKEKMTSGVDEKKLRAEIEKELRPKIAEEELKKLTKKLKGTEKENFRSLTDVPGGGDEVETGTKVMDEETWARLKKKDPKKAEEMLMGM